MLAIRLTERSAHRRQHPQQQHPTTRALQAARSKVRCAKPPLRRVRGWERMQIPYAQRCRVCLSMVTSQVCSCGHQVMRVNIRLPPGSVILVMLFITATVLSKWVSAYMHKLLNPIPAHLVTPSPVALAIHPSLPHHQHPQR